MLMKSLVFQNSVARRFRRSQRGQSIVLLALAFLALIAFVGLVTDVAMMFVRYASLRRAVDAAAIAAAGQIREGTDYAEVTMAAEQYIQLHGLDPDTVLVETCETDIYQWREGLGPWEDDPHPEEYVVKDGNTILVPVGEQMGENTELCNWENPRKLVRVSAQITSPTSFLRLFGFDDFTLEATSLSETAVLDVALVIDTSESMSKYTYLPSATETRNTIYDDSGLTAEQLSDRCFGGYSSASFKYRWGGCCNDVGTGQVGDGDNAPIGLLWHDANVNNVYDPGEEGVLPGTMTDWAAYDADPRAAEEKTDYFNFTTLVCEPFKQVKDAARLFIKRLDFVRGDRVVFVTFDRNGTVYDLDGAANSALRPLINSEEVAIDTLNRKIGVWINPNQWYDWNRCQEELTSKLDWAAWVYDEAADPATEPDLRPYAYESIAPCGNTNIGGGIRSAVGALTDPDDIRREAVWVMIVLSDGAANATDQSANVPAGYEGIEERVYGQYGYCPWWTFCRQEPIADPVGNTPASSEPWPQCTGNNPSQVEFQVPTCNDDDPTTRHFCLKADLQQEAGNPECGETGHYDADDYARDMADFAGLIEIADGQPGNFIAMYSIAFGDEVTEAATGAPLLRYIADAGDNGRIDNDTEQAWRDAQELSGSVDENGEDPCAAYAGVPEQQCGQYYFANPDDPQDLLHVFEQIASRMFTRISR